MKRGDKDTVLASLDNLEIISACADELHALAMYELWRVSFQEGTGTIDGLGIEDLHHATWVKRSALRRERHRNAGRGGRRFTAERGTQQ